MYTFIIFVLIYILLDYYSEHFCLKCSPFAKYKKQVVSFSAGITLAYLLLQIFPETFGTAAHSLVPFALAMVAFTTLYYLHQRIGTEKDYGYKETHLLIRSVYHFLVGIIIFHLASESLFTAIIVILPLYINTIFSTLSAHHADHINKAMLSQAYPWLQKIALFSPLFGALLAYWLHLEIETFLAIFGFISGALIYTVINEYLGDTKHISSGFLLLGQLIFILFLSITFFV